MGRGLWVSLMAGQKFDQLEVKPNTGALGSDLDDVLPFGHRPWSRHRCPRSRPDPADRVGTKMSVPRPKSAPEKRDIVKLRALSDMLGRISG